MIVQDADSLCTNLMRGVRGSIENVAVDATTRRMLVGEYSSPWLDEKRPVFSRTVYDMESLQLACSPAMLKSRIDAWLFVQSNASDISPPILCHIGRAWESVEDVYMRAILLRVESGATGSLTSFENLCARAANLSGPRQREEILDHGAQRRWNLRDLPMDMRQGAISACRDRRSFRDYCKLACIHYARLGFQNRISALYDNAAWCDVDLFEDLSGRVACMSHYDSFDWRLHFVRDDKLVNTTRAHASASRVQRPSCV